MNELDELCPECVDSDEGQVLIASWKVLLHLLKTSRQKVDCNYLTEIQIAAGIQGEQTMPLFTQAVLRELGTSKKGKKTG